MADLSPVIGSIDGIKIELHWTFLLLLMLILAINLYLFVIWVLLFSCVLIHELVHSITSRRNGIPVKKIVLYPLGGGSIIDFENVSPDVEFRISIVGPIASLLISALIGIATIFTPAGIVKGTMQTLFLLNLFLGAFNLLPWLPLDGGRALRSYLQKKRSFLDATKLAVKSSNAITALFIAGTVVYAIMVPGFTTAYRELIVLFDVIVAFFIYSGAQSELQSAFIKENISSLRVKDAISKNYVVLKAATRVSDLYDTLLRNRTHIVLFMKGGNVQIMSSSSLKRLMKRTDLDKVEDFGINVPTVEYGASLYSAIERMRMGESNVAVAMKAGKIAGVLLMQHIESIVALHISEMKRKKAHHPSKGRQTNK